MIFPGWWFKPHIFNQQPLVRKYMGNGLKTTQPARTGQPELILHTQLFSHQSSPCQFRQMVARQLKLREGLIKPGTVADANVTRLMMVAANGDLTRLKVSRELKLADLAVH